MDLLPTLEMITVDMRHIPHYHIASDPRASIRGAFNPLITALQEAGRPITFTSL